MADNIAVTPGTGVTVAADEVTDGTLGSVKVQYVKIMDGTLDGTAKAAVGANGLKADLGGWTYWSTSHDNSNVDLGLTVVAVKASAGTLGGWSIYNPNSAVAYLQVFDVARASVTVGTTRPNLSIGIPATSAVNLELTAGVTFATAISIATATTPSGNTGNSTALPVSLFYK